MASLLYDWESSNLQKTFFNRTVDLWNKSAYLFKNVDIFILYIVGKLVICYVSI